MTTFRWLDHRRTTAAIVGALVMVLAGGSALAASGAGRKLARDGRWSGRTSQGLRIVLQVRNHRVVSVSGTIRLTPYANFAAGACKQPRRFRATLSSEGSAPGRSTESRFSLWIVRDPFASVSGRIANASTIKGTLKFQGEGDPDPCFATVHYSAHPSPR